ncbi:MAG TPA: hypothetical protein VKV25_02305, partial [Acidimicrobiales bacterium]|nr:hypothetical protein [Acidimicrobiales bacterium]
AVVMAPVAFVAVLSALRAQGAPAAVTSRGATRRRRQAASTSRRPLGAIGPAVVAGVVPLLALAGVIPALLGVLAGGVLAASSAGHGRRGGSRRRGPRRSPAVLGRRGAAALAAVLPALASAGAVLATGQGTELAFVLVAGVLLFDLGNAVMGTGSTGGLVGAISGGLTVVLWAVVVEAVLDPPFVGVSAFVLCGIVAVLGPVGVWLCRTVAPGRVPALRRLDSLVLVAPLWVAGVALLVPH